MDNCRVSHFQITRGSERRCLRLHILPVPLAAACTPYIAIMQVNTPMVDVCKEISSIEIMPIHSAMRRDTYTLDVDLK